MSSIYWIGPRESDIAYTNGLFAGSFTFYGSGQDGNRAFCGVNPIRINHNLFSAAASDYILARQMESIVADPNCRFMAYNPNCTYGAPKEIMERMLCLNDEQLMRKVDDKISFRRLFGDIVPMIPMRVLKSTQCSVDALRSLFPGFSVYVVQEPVSTGGQGTLLLNEHNQHSVAKNLDPEADYIVMGYIDRNIPINIHAMIYDREILIFPGSVQMIRRGNGRLLYRGADYPAYRSIEPSIRERFESLSMPLLREMQRMNYRGVVGVDAMIHDGEIYFTEVNNRFQGSSVVLTKALSEQGLPSLQEMNLAAFSGQEPDDALLDAVKRLRPSESMYTFIQTGDTHAAEIFERARQKGYAVLSEGYRPEQPAEPYASLFSVIFQGNISSLSDEFCVRLHPNIAGMTGAWQERIFSDDLTALKISLLNRGAVLTKAAKRYIHEHGDMREGTYFSLDLFLRGVYINTPLSIKLTNLSPFTIDAGEEGLTLLCYGRKLTELDYDRKEKLPIRPGADNPPVEKILFLATDRLRVQNNAYCTFAKNGVPCRFCEAVGINNAFSERDILDSLDLIFTAEKRPAFRHILIGGLSNDIGREQETILKICRKIRDYSDMPIYLMCLPPEPEDIRRYFDAGVTEFGFNLELFDRTLARQIMPGKGAIPLQRYYDALEEAVRLCGRRGAVRTAFIAGLEPMSSLLDGVETVCRMGVAPILSAFRPIPGTELGEWIPPSDEWLYEATERAETICRMYGLTLGPECPACCNNTLTFVREHEVETVYSPLWRRGGT